MLQEYLQHLGEARITVQGLTVEWMWRQLADDALQELTGRDAVCSVCFVVPTQVKRCSRCQRRHYCSSRCQKM